MKIDNEKRIEEIRSTRENSLESQARKKAVILYGALQPFTKGVHNSGNIFERIVAARILERQPLSFTAFWGVGSKRQPDVYDEKLLSELVSMRSAVLAVYPAGSHIRLLLADEHGQFNRFPKTQIYEYLVRIQDEARKRDIVTIWLSDLYQTWNLAVPDSKNPVDRLSPYALLWKDPKYFRQRTQLIESAGRHHQLTEDPEQIAYHYTVMRLQEAPLLAKAFPDTILLINSSKDLAKPLLPQDLPHFYLRTPPVWFQEAK